MQSVNQPVAGKKMGHTRRQSYGKIMPISTLLSNLIGPTTTTNTTTTSKTASGLGVTNTVTEPTSAPLSHSFEALAMNSRVNERSDGDRPAIVTDLTLNFINHEKVDDRINQNEILTVEPLAARIDIDKTFLKCTNYHHRDSVTEIPEVPVVANAKVDPEDDIDRVLVDDDAPCLICTNKATVKHSLMNVLCKKLCDDSCNTSTKTCQSNDDIVTEKSDVSSSEHDNDVAVDYTDAQRKIENAIQRSNSSRHEFLTSMLRLDQNDNADGDVDDHNNECNNIENDNHISGNEKQIAPLTIENLKQFNNDYFREKLAIAEALVNTSMMTSAAAKSRLAARKIEMSLNTPDFVYDPENAEYIPPKELLMYLVR